MIRAVAPLVAVSVPLFVPVTGLLAVTIMALVRVPVAVIPLAVVPLVGMTVPVVATAVVPAALVAVAMTIIMMTVTPQRAQGECRHYRHHDIGLVARTSWSYRKAQRQHPGGSRPYQFFSVLPDHCYLHDCQMMAPLYRDDS